LALFLKSRDTFEFANFNPNVVPRESVDRSNGNPRELNGHARTYWYSLQKQRGSSSSRPQAQQSSSVQL